MSSEQSEDRLSVRPEVEALYANMGYELVISDGSEASQTVVAGASERDNQLARLRLQRTLLREGHQQPAYSGSGLGPSSSLGGRRRHYYIMRKGGQDVGEKTDLPSFWTTAIKLGEERDMRAGLNLIALEAAYKQRATGSGYFDSAVVEMMQESLETFTGRSEYTAHAEELEKSRLLLMEMQSLSGPLTKETALRTLGLPASMNIHDRKLLFRQGDGAWKERLRINPVHKKFDPVNRHNLDPEDEHPELRCFASALEAYNYGGITLALSEQDWESLQTINDTVEETWESLKPLTSSVRMKIQAEPSTSYDPISDVTEKYKERYRQLLAQSHTYNASAEVPSSRAAKRQAKRALDRASSKAATRSLTNEEARQFPVFLRCAVERAHTAPTGTTDHSTLLRQYLHHARTGEPVTDVGTLASLVPEDLVISHLKQQIASGVPLPGRSPQVMQDVRDMVLR